MQSFPIAIAVKPDPSLHTVMRDGQTGAPQDAHQDHGGALQLAAFIVFDAGVRRLIRLGVDATREQRQATSAFKKPER